MDRPTCIRVTKVPEGWMYENVYQDTKEHAQNLDILFKQNGTYEVLLDQERIILPEHPKYDYILRVHSNEDFRWHSQKILSV